MERWLTGKDLLVRWGINVPTLKEWIVSGLKAYDPNAHTEMRFSSVKEFAREEMKTLTSWASERCPDLYPQQSITTSYRISVEALHFKFSEIEVFERQNVIEKKDDPVIPVRQQKTEGRKKPDRRTLEYDEFKIKCRQVALDIRQENPKVTITDMTDRVMKQFPDGYKGRTASAATVRNWIKDVSLNHSPGRPSQK